MRHMILITVALAACGGSSPRSNALPSADPSSLIMARVDGGVIAGVIDDDVAYFKGIPYAAPPTGDLRWRPPQRVSEWTGFRRADKYGPDCIQSVIPGDASATDGKTDEDCLYLNVWAPHGDTGAKRPVLVWLHGGGFVNGGASTRCFDGSSFARNGVVVVSPNYRLGRMGFFAHPALSAEMQRPVANFGLLDQLAALEWVRQNIAAFGGDPNQITIAGQSAGGASVIHLMTSSAGRGLFQRAIVLSGGGRGYINKQRDLKRARGGLASAEQSGVDFAASVGITEKGPAALAKLRALPAQKVNGSLNMVALAASPRTYAGGPIHDGVVVTDVPEKLLRSGNAARIPLLIGTTGSDLPRFLPRDAAEPYAEFGELEDQARQLYESRELMSPSRAASVVAADMVMHEPARFVARQLTQRGGRVWLYRFDYVMDSQRPQELRASRGSELPFLFDQLAMAIGRNASERDHTVAKAFHNYVVNFVKGGDPNGPGLQHWSQFNPEKYDLMMFGRDGGTRMQTDPYRERIALIEAARN